MFFLIHKNVSGTVQGTGDAVKSKTHEVSNLGEFPIR